MNQNYPIVFFKNSQRLVFPVRHSAKMIAREAVNSWLAVHEVSYQGGISQG